MGLPHAEEAVVPEAKINGYLLNENHPEGRSKARFLVRRGFSRAEPDTLREALLELARTSEMEETLFEYGLKYRGIGPLECPDGTRPGFVTVWVLIDGVPPPRLVTAYPDPRRR